MTPCKLFYSWSSSDGLPYLRPVTQITSTNVDIARVAPQYHLYTQAEVEEVMWRI